MCSVNAMPVWSMVKACQTRLAPMPGKANVLVRRIGTVLARMRPAGLTTVPMTASTPSASSCAIAAAASGVVVTCGRSGSAGQGQRAALPDVEGAQHPSHSDPQRTRQRQIREQLVGEVLAAALPEVFVFAQHRVLGGEPVREFGGQPLLFAVSRPGAPLVRVRVKLFVYPGRRPVAVAGVEADPAFVVVRDHYPGEFAGAHRQTVAVVDGVAE